MISKRTIEKYLERIDELIKSNDVVAAEDFIEEISLVLENDYDSLLGRLSIYNSYSESIDPIKDLKLIRRTLEADYDKYLEDSEANSKPERMRNKIFISHSTKDKDYSDALIELLNDIGLTSDDVFYSSNPFYGVPLNNDIYDTLLSEFLSNKLHVLFLLSSNYYESPTSLNEMGAAWLCKNEYTMFLLPGFEFSDVKGVVDKDKIGIKLDSDKDEIDKRLDEFKEILDNEFELKKIEIRTWERYKKAFIDRTLKIFNLKLENANLADSDEGKLLLSSRANILLMFAAHFEKRLVIETSLSGKILTLDKFVVSASMEQSNRDVAAIKGAILELENHGYITCVIDKKGYVEYEVTNLGYSYADVNKGKFDIDYNLPPNNYFESL